MNHLMLALSRLTKSCLGSLADSVMIRLEMPLEYSLGLEAPLLSAQELPVSEQPDSEIPCHYSPALGLGLSGFAPELIALEPPGSWLLELDLSVLEPGWRDPELLAGSLAVLLEVREVTCAKGRLRLAQG